MRLNVGVDRDNLGYLLAKASQRWNELLHEGFRHHGYADVRPAYGSVLLPLFEEDGLRMGALAVRARLSKQTMTTLVRLMEAAGLVRRVRDPDDGRAYRVWLTERSRAFRPVAAEVLDGLDRHVRSQLSPADLEATRTVLKGVMDLWSPEQSPPSSAPPPIASSRTSPTSRTSRAGRPSSPAS
ncbi:MAG: MarR family transcriptional regulator [Actinobacteria bacterium]|nr:MAG: MarR family transcriptional regulator [Actinomycetota bacterium]